MIPTINKPTRVTRKTATAIDHILTNCFIDRTFKTAIFKCDISDHFPICFIIPSMKTKIKNETSFLYKRNFNTDAKHAFFEKCLILYDKYFPKQKIKVKSKDLQSPWVTKGIKKSSKKKQRLYQKFLKNRNVKNETEYKSYKKLFETIKKRSKKNHFSKLILKYKDNVKKCWAVIKDAIGKSRYTQHTFPKKINFP